eukprot:XP_001691988.1 RecA-like protein [Chlamydomonas reinhardtii]
MVRWDELAASLPPTVLSRLSASFPSVEAFLVSCSKSAAASGAHGAHAQGLPTPPASVSAACGVDAVTLAAVEGVVAGLLAPQWSTGLQLVERLHTDTGLLTTGSNTIDGLLAGGLRQGMVVEVAGETASGKTQLCLLAAAAAALQGHEVMFVDTTGSFKPDRVVQLAEGLVTGGSGSAAAGAAGRHDPAELAQHLGGCIHVHRAANVFELLTFLDRLDVSLQACGHQSSFYIHSSGLT